ncbi:hypothetical protein [Pseudorhodoplanes sinuspersici]|uniref:hypothetical protein n=1 Tax=Pseudorhodoplanes sinuspersici TaxID=1235591 RepID=UPI001FD88F51|nr:hypothetical protein [Pseudorhodoplanes sinuspersici]
MKQMMHRAAGAHVVFRVNLEEVDTPIAFKDFSRMLMLEADADRVGVTRRFDVCFGPHELGLFLFGFGGSWRGCQLPP